MVDSRGQFECSLKTCIKLLPDEKYPEIVTSSHYMLSDLYIPVETNPDNSKLDQEESDKNDFFFDDEEDDDEDPMKFLVLDTNAKHKFDNQYKPPPLLIGSIEERCLQAINHMASGINCLQNFTINKKEEKESEPEIPMAKSSETI